ncbi:MAG: DHHW family protein [Oscillospiraceae bacterium]|nr:DHHW family protein [Oscillospiraceae bacterium]MDD4368112.1 DHHW family protein [Oscillospiraceae bacterium]
MKQHHEVWIIVAFISPLLLLACLYLWLPPQTVSSLEKRELQQRPVFSWDALWNGDLADQWEQYYTDQLPWRSLFIKADQTMTGSAETIFGLNKRQLVHREADGNLGQGENLGTEGKTLLSFPSALTATPTPAPASSAGDLTAETSGIVSADETQLPADTQATLAELTLPDEDAYQTDNGILISGNRAMEIFYSSETVDQAYAEVVNRLKAIAGQARLINMLVPISSAFYAPADYRSGSSDQAQVIPQIYSLIDDAVIKVDAYSALRQHVNEYIYFRTDHHWTQLGAYYAYQALARASGNTPADLDACVSGQIEGTFLGTLYAWSGQVPALEAEPDYVDYWYPDLSVQGYIYSDSSMTEGYSCELVKTDTSAANKYLAFIEGDHGLSRFSSIQNGRSLLVIKESYGNALVPFLTQNYEDVYVFDPRQMTLSLADFIADHQIDDILMINYSQIIGNREWLNSLAESLK